MTSRDASPPGGTFARLDTPEDASAWQAVAEWYHAAFTGLVLGAVTRLGTATAAELVYRVFCRQREARFLDGLRKLGLDRLPHAVAAAQYHYLSNDIGGVAVQTMRESDRKAWVRYVPPRWVWAGTALCAVPSEVTVAMLRGWHAQNGTMLGNPRLGFVCTKMTTDGDASLEGYYLEHDRDLRPDERLRFARDEDGPDFDPAAVPALGSASWPPERLARARRNYAMEYLRTTLPVAVGLIGGDDTVRVLGLSLRQVGLQYYAQAAGTLGLPAGGDAGGFARFLCAMARGQGDEAAMRTAGDAVIVEQAGARLFAGADRVDPAAVMAWNGLWEGALAAHDHRLALSCRLAGDDGRSSIAWTIARRPRA
jgi:hypothetical protein